MLREGLKCKQLEENAIYLIQREIQINNHKVDNGLKKPSSEIISSNSGKMTPFMKLSWEQQKRLFTSSSSWARYHPVIIRFCLSATAKSPSV